MFRLSHRDAAFRLFTRAFNPFQLSVEESYETYYDTLEGRWGWWVRIEGHSMRIRPEKKRSCDQEIRGAISRLRDEKGIRCTLHQLHVKLRRA